jgi:hypothetical protein
MSRQGADLKKSASDRLREAAERSLLAKMSERSPPSEVEMAAFVREALRHAYHDQARPQAPLADRILFRLAGVRWWAWAALSGLVLALCIAFAAPARAAVVELGKWGAWSLHGGTTNAGVRTCALGASAGGDRLIMIQYYAGEQTLHVRLARRSWQIADGARVSVRSRVGDRLFVSNAEPRGSEIRWFITSDTMDDWEIAFRASAVMQVEFLTGNEPPWTISLAGSARAIANLRTCIRALADMGGATTPGWAAPAPPPPPAPTTPGSSATPTGPARRT